MRVQAACTWKRTLVIVVVVLVPSVAGLQNETASHPPQQEAPVPNSNNSAGPYPSTEDTMYITIEENDPGPFPKVLVTIGMEDGDLLVWLQGPGADQPPVGLFVLDRPSNHLSVTASLDREQNAGFQLRLKASSSDGKTSHYLWIAVTVVDQNDNAPRFPWHDLQAVVPRNASPGTRVTLVQAKDADDEETLYGQVSYSLVGQKLGSAVANIFTINASTGAIHTQHTLTKMDGDVFVLEVMARDCRGAAFGRSDKARVTVTVTDSIGTTASTSRAAAAQPRAPELQEDESMVLLSMKEPSDGEAVGGGRRCPVFSPDVVNVEILEELPPGQILLNIRTTNNSQIDELRLEGDRAGWLSVDALTGEVVTRAPLDRESRYVVNDTYLVNIVAAMHVSVPGAAGCTGSVALLVRLLDVNDNTPWPSPPLLQLCQTPVYGDAMLYATDADGPGNGAPFTFRVLPSGGRDGGANNGDGDDWILTQPNGSVAMLLPRTSRLRLGEHSLPVSLCDRRGLCGRANVDIVVHACKAAATASAIALPVVLALAGIIALATALVCCARIRARDRLTGI